MLRHGKTAVWIEDNSTSASDPKEAEADQFACDVLIPPKEAKELSQLKTDAAVRKFSANIGVAPGVVVGRLQHDGHWAHSRGHSLKRRLDLASL